MSSNVSVKFKVPFVFAAFKTSDVFIFIFLKIIESSFTSAIFKSLWVFSITLAASALLYFSNKFLHQ